MCSINITCVNIGEKANMAKLSMLEVIWVFKEVFNFSVKNFKVKGWGNRNPSLTPSCPRF